jgi:uncharacterized protein
LPALSAVAVAAGLLWAAHVRPSKRLAPVITLEPRQILADRRDYAILTVAGDPSTEPDVRLSGATTDSVRHFERTGRVWTAKVRAGVRPGIVRVRASFGPGPAAFAELTALLDSRDSGGDGTPDVMRLDSEQDREAFRQWFAYLAEAWFFAPAAARPAEIVDCAALIRYAYRQALVDHGQSWAVTSNLPVVPAFQSAAKGRDLFALTGAALFRVTPGPFRKNDLTTGAFLQFADVQHLWRYNTHRVRGGLERALPGDLLFFRRQGEHTTYHSMIYLGQSLIRPDGRRYVVYHTGPEGADPGEIRRPSIDELLQFPRVEWRPLESNPSFLGVYRWNILRRGSDTR